MILLLYSFIEKYLLVVIDFLIKTDPKTKKDRNISVCVNKVTNGRLISLVHHMEQRSEVKGLSVFQLFDLILYFRRFVQRTS